MSSGIGGGGELPVAVVGREEGCVPPRAGTRKRKTQIIMTMDSCDCGDDL